MTKHRQVSRLVALENAPSIDPCLMIRFGLTAAVADQIVDNTGIPTRAPTAEAGAVSRIIAPTLLTLRTRVFEPFDASARRMSPGPQGGQRNYQYRSVFLERLRLTCVSNSNESGRILRFGDRRTFAKTLACVVAATMMFAA